MNITDLTDGRQTTDGRLFP